MPSLQGRLIAAAFFVGILLVGFSSKADHMDLTRVVRVYFVCDTPEKIIGLIEAHNDADADQVLGHGGCFVHNTGVPSKLIAYHGTYRDPMFKKDKEVYEVYTANGETFFTYVSAPVKGDNI